MITPGETDATQRRIYFAIYIADGSALALDAAVGLPAGAVKVSINGAALVNAGGTLAHVGRGEYYYEATAGEVASAGFLAVVFARTNYRTEIQWDAVGQLFDTGETDLTRLRLPLTIYGTSLAPPTLATGATVTTGSDLQISKSGAALANAAGTLHEVGSGLYYYQGVLADAGAPTTLSVQYQSTGFATTLTTYQVVNPASLKVPIISSITPTPNVAPGTPGAFSTDFRAARLTPIHFQLTSVAGQVTINAQYADRNERYVVLDMDGTFCWPFDTPDNTIGNLAVEPVAVQLLPRGGWPPTTVHFQVGNSRPSL